MVTDEQSRAEFADAVPMEKATPGPWSVIEITPRDGSGTYLDKIVDACGNTIRVEGFSLSQGEEARANAALIVRAVNCHADLLSALEAARPLLAHGGCPVGWIDAAIARARGEA